MRYSGAMTTLSRPPHATTLFTLSSPFLDVNGSAAHLLGEARPPRKPRLLLAEDDLSTRRFLQELLEPQYAVEAAADGELAWAAARREVPALVLTDLQMPNLDGPGLIRRLRAHAGTAQLPIILLTACHEKEMLLRGLAAGADDFLLKPFSCAELLACLEFELAAPRSERDHGATYQTRLRAMTAGLMPSAP